MRKRSHRIQTQSMLLICIFLCFFTLSEISADETLKTNTSPALQEYPSALGISLSTIENVGLSWKRWFGKTGVEVAVGGLWDPSATDGNIYWYSVYGAVSHRLFAEDFSDWFSGGLDLVFLAGHAGEEGFEYDASSSNYIRTGYVPYLHFGAGIGIEMVMFRHFSQELQFLYIARFLNNPGIHLGLNASFRYRYK